MHGYMVTFKAGRILPVLSTSNKEFVPYLFTQPYHDIMHVIVKSSLSNLGNFHTTPPVFFFSKKKKKSKICYFLPNKAGFFFIFLKPTVTNVEQKCYSFE